MNDNKINESFLGVMNLKKLKNLTLLVGGILIGVTLSYSPQIYGAGAKLLGSKVTNTLEVKLDNKSIGQAAVINGTSYLPIRSMANALDVEVASVDSKEVNLSSSEQPVSEPVTEPTTETPPASGTTDPITSGGDTNTIDNSAKIASLQKQISDVQYTITSRDNFIKGRESKLSDFKAVAQANPDENNPFWDFVKSTEKEIADAQADLKVQQEKLADLQTQLAELQK